jgi:glycosyltransferase involved in cell wall biosynthesis
MAAALPAPPRFADYATEPRPGVPAGGWRRPREGKAGDQGAPLVSIVTIVRNGASTLPRTIESVLTQDYPCIEHVVVDGGSTDGTLDILRANDARLALWASEPDRGISDAFNKGIALSRGDIVGILNSDDWYQAGAIRDAVAALNASGADIVCGRLQYWEGGRRTYLVTSDPAKLERGMTVGHPTVFVRRQCYEAIGLYRLDFRLAMDYEWLLRAKAHESRFVAVDTCLSNMQGGGIGDRRWRMSQREVAKARAMHVKGADGQLAYHGYVVRALTRGLARRGLDAAGLSVLRRLYHRYLSPVEVVSHRDGSER